MNMVLVSSTGTIHRSQLLQVGQDRFHHSGPDVDDDVEPAELGSGARDHCVDARDIAAIGPEGDRPPRIAGRLAGRALHRGEVDVGSRHVGAGLGHRQRRGAPDPTPAPVTSTTLSCRIDICAPPRVS